MTYTLEQAKADYEALGKRIAGLEKSANPIDLGQVVAIDNLTAEAFEEWVKHDIEFSPAVKVSVEKHGNDECVVIRVPWGDDRDECLELAKALVARCGGSSD